jgi:hypothetical protein
MTWPQIPPRPGGKIVHSWRCDRAAPVVETVRELHDGERVVCWQCAGCDGTDASERLLARLDRPDDAA